MDSFVCKIATRGEIIKRMNYLIETHPNNNVWIEAKENALKGFDEQSKIMYIGVLNDEIICEATTYIKESAFIGDVKEPEGLLSKTMAYFSGFRTNKEYEGKGYFGKLYNFMEDDLKKRGYTEFCLGVKPRNVRNMEIYFHLGFREFIKSIIEYEPVKNNKSKTELVVINYFKKKI